MTRKKVLYIIAHNIRSAHNVGAIFRTADGAGVKKIFLTGYTPSPYDSKKNRFLTQAHRRLSKTALGAEKKIIWESKKNIGFVMARLAKEKFQIIALEKEDQATDFKKFKPCFPAALILGNEVRGIDRKVLKKCDAVISIPMRGKKESLNVTVAAGIAVYEILK
jgi:23S rRNA (guanosine2251-2'-O)-methyltransferase